MTGNGYCRYAEGDQVSLDTEAGRLVSQTTGATAQAVPLPGFPREIVAVGGISPQLEAALLLATRL